MQAHRWCTSTSTARSVQRCPTVRVVGSSVVASGASGHPRTELTHVRADGAVDPAWKTRVLDTSRTEARVDTLLVVGPTVYIGGYVTRVDGRPRRNLAAVSARTGRVRAWSPRPNGTVSAWQPTPHVGGAFTRISNAARRGLASFDAVTGAQDAWSPTVAGRVLVGGRPRRQLAGGRARQSLCRRAVHLGRRAPSVFPCGLRHSERSAEGLASQPWRGGERPYDRRRHGLCRRELCGR